MTTGGANGRRFCFLTERQVGIGSAAAALEPWVRARPNVVWRDITYYEPGGVIERLKLGGRAAGTLRGYLQSGAALRQGRFDALFFLTHNPAVFRQSDLARTPTLLWTDVTPALLDSQADQYEHPVDRFEPLKVIKKSMVRRTFERAALLVGWSDWARRSFVSDYGAAEARTRVVPPGIDLSHWRTENPGNGEGLPRLLFVGGNLVRKGGDLLLEVFRRHFRGRCALDIVTRDELAEEDDVRVHRGLTPTSPRLLDLYRSATAFVLPTRGDCFSIASIEAMAMSLPVVVSEVGGIAEIVLPRETGYLIRPGDGGELREAIDALLADGGRRLAMGKSGRARAEACFDARKTADRLIALMDEIASARG